MSTELIIGITVPVASFIISLVTALLVVSHKLGEYKGKVDRACSDIEKLEGEQKGIRDKVVECATSLKERESLTKRKSPISLSERGVAFLNNSGGEKFVNDNFEELFRKVEERTPQTAYDVQEYAKVVVEELREDERINIFKEFLFKDGSTLDDLFTVMSIYLRDKILEKKTWNVEDIDGHK